MVQIPWELWSQILSSPALEWTDLNALSLVCRDLRDVSQQYLLSKVHLEFDETGLSIQHVKTRAITIDSDYDPSFLEHLEYLKSARIASFVRTCTVKYLRSMNPTHVDYQHIVKILDVLPWFTRLEELQLIEVVFHRHSLQALQHVVQQSTHISFTDCTIADLDIDWTPLECSSVQINQNHHQVRPTSRRHRNVADEVLLLIKGTITQTLVELDLNIFSDESRLYKKMSNTGIEFQSLRAFSTNEESLLKMRTSLSLFSAIRSLHIRLSALRASDLFNLSSIPPSTAFPELEELDCPLHLLPRFIASPLRKLTVYATKSSIHDGWRLSSELVKHYVAQSAPLLAKIQTLAIYELIDEDEAFEFLILHCKSLQSLVAEICHSPFRPLLLGEAMIKIYIQLFLDRLVCLDWPPTLRVVDIAPPFCLRTENKSPRSKATSIPVYHNQTPGIDRNAHERIYRAALASWLYQRRHPFRAGDYPGLRDGVAFRLTFYDRSVYFQRNSNWSQKSYYYTFEHLVRPCNVSDDSSAREWYLQGRGIYASNTHNYSPTANLPEHSRLDLGSDSDSDSDTGPDSDSSYRNSDSELNLIFRS